MPDETFRDPPTIWRPSVRRRFSRQGGTDGLRPGPVQDHHPPAVGGRRRGMAPLGADAGGLARPGNRAHARRRRRRGRRPRARRGRRSGWPDPGRGPPGRRRRLGRGHRHLTHDPHLRRQGRRRSRADQRRDHRGGRGDARLAPGRVVRRGDLPRRAHLLPRPAARPGRHPPGAQRRRTDGGDRLLDAPAQRVLLHSGVDHPRSGAAASPGAGPARAVQPRRAGRPARPRSPRRASPT